MRTRTRPGPRPFRAAACLVALAIAAAGCSTGPATIERTDPPASDQQSASDRVGGEGADALRTKFRFFAADVCATGAPAETYPRCARFTTEIRNVVPQVRGDVPAAAGTADAAEQALNRLAAAGCEAAPGSAGTGDPATCGPLFAEVQRTTREMARAVGTPG